MPARFTSNDFVNHALADLGRSVSYRAPTIYLDNETGKQTITLGSASTITGVFLRKQQSYQLDQSGFFESGDAFLMTAPTVTVAKEGQVEIESRKFRVDDTIARRIGNTHMHNFTRLFLWGES